MELLRYALRNVFSRRFRTAMISTACLIASSLFILSFSVGETVNEHVRDDLIAKVTGHLRIKRNEAASYSDENDRLMQQQSARIERLLASDPRVSTWFPSDFGLFEIQKDLRRESVHVNAIDFEKDRVFRSRIQFTAGAYPSVGSEAVCILSEPIASKLGAAVGDAITFLVPTVYGAMNAVDFVVQGIYQATAPWYENEVRISSKEYLAIRDLKGVNLTYKIYVKRMSDIPFVARDLNDSLDPKACQAEAFDQDEFFKFVLSLGKTDATILGFVSFVIFFAFIGGIQSILLADIHDRRKEIGTLRAIGFTRRFVVGHLMAELLFQVLLGFVGSLLVVFPLQLLINSLHIEPPLRVIEYMLGMTRLSLTVSGSSVFLSFAVLMGTTTAACYWSLSREAEKSAAAQMSKAH